jgi:pimeloyl-ACP methyl ester carboxylesterase
VGHSFGGGVALQFAYQYPELTERVVLVASGGLGQEVNLALRAATLPGASAALKVVTASTPRWLTAAGSRVARAVPASWTELQATVQDQLAAAG